MSGYGVVVLVGAIIFLFIGLRMIIQVLDRASKPPRIPPTDGNGSSGPGKPGGIDPT